jgi:acetyl-CoA carboxylase biotin carboxyl carrier protein
MDLKEIQNLIKFVANSGVAEVKLETGDVKITIRTTLEGNTPDITYVQQTNACSSKHYNKQLQQQIAAAPVATPAAPVR